uniref:Zinc finger domain containing protein n=1 Tax=Haemonchus contortus TaxID=6289 RepID=A0A7I4XWF3_HAECO
MDFADLMPISGSTPPIAISDPNGIQELCTDGTYNLTELGHCAESLDQNSINVVPYADIFEGLDYERPSTSQRSGISHADHSYRNAEDEDQDIQKFYYMTEDSFEDVIAKLEEEIRKEEEEAKEKVAATDEIIKEMEKDAKNFIHVRELIKKRDKHNKVAAEVKEEKNRIIEMKRQLAIANKNTAMFCCFVCSKVFLDEEQMRQHVSEQHLASKKQYKYKCPSCYRVFIKQQHLRNHSFTHQNTGVTCSICKRSFREAVSLKIHMSKVHSQTEDGVKIEKTIACKCGQKFGIIEELKRHKYYCGAKEQIAERRRQAREELDAMSSVTSMSSPPRSIISSSSGAASALSIGSASGRPVKDKSCPFCFLVCASMQSRRRHIERKHPEKLSDPKVDEYDYVKVLSPALPYACNICSKTFASHASLTTHKKRIHENVNVHECTVCGRSYPLPSELRKHMRRVHEKNFE